MTPRGTLWGSFCVVVTLSVIETIWNKFGQNLGFSLRNSVPLSPGPAVKIILADCATYVSTLMAFVFECRGESVRLEALIETPNYKPPLFPDFLPSPFNSDID